MTTTLAVRQRSRLSHPVAFVAIAVIFLTFTAASSAPSPLYVVYQELWGFSAVTLTVIFAVYVVGLIASLLVLGALSDHVGRRPVLAAAVVLEVAALIVFVTAGNVTMLLVARFVQGVATGMAFTTLGAALVDLNPPHAPGRAGLLNSLVPPIGLSIGSLGAGALVQYAPGPTHLVWAILLAAMVVAAAIVLLMPETSARRPGGVASLLPKLGVPQRLRVDFFAIVPIILASWALAGLYMSLGPSIAVGVFGLHSHLIGGLVVALLCGTGAVTAFSLRTFPTPRNLMIAGVMLTVGTAVTLVGMELESVVVAAVGTVLAGIGFGASSLASFGTLALLAAPDERGELFAVALTISYVAFSIPAVIAGLAANTFDLRATGLVYGLVVVALGGIAVILQKARKA
ncbi:MFS transporter [Actinoplanes sp. RD1]|uniref:MFS transporter n=1 Tax=Actinoplanes sp. RD1 TaxID=3064538 RepID=UPI002740EF38|nr:MFS transporter [Actinoplanes sp. RD1]